MRMVRMNRKVLSLDDAHPAKRFLLAFIDCKADCVGRELGSGEEVPIEQAWKSATDGRVWTFSGFAYMFLSLDISVDEYLGKPPSKNELETFTVGTVPLLRLLIQECAQAAQHDGNSEILKLTDQVLKRLDLWEEFLRFRAAAIPPTPPAVHPNGDNRRR